MKRVILYSLLVLILAALVYEGCKRVQPPSDTFKVGLDSLHRENDSLKADIQQKTDQIDSLYTVDVESYITIQELKGDIAAAKKHTKAAKKAVKTLTDPGLVSQLNQRYPADTVSNELLVARPVLVSAAEDLVELDGAKEVIKTQDSIIVVSDVRLITKDSIISKFLDKEAIYKKVLVNKDTEIRTWTKEHLSLQLQNKNLQVKVKAQKTALYIAAGLFVTAMLIK